MGFLKVKSIITFAIIAVFCILALRKDIEPESTMIVVTAIITYFFSKANTDPDTK